LPALDDHTDGCRFAARGAICRQNSGRRLRDSSDRRRLGRWCWVAITDETISKSRTPKSPLARKGPVVKTSVTNASTTKSPAVKASGMKTPAFGLGSSNADRGGEGDSNDDGSSHQ